MENISSGSCDVDETYTDDSKLTDHAEISKKMAKSTMEKANMVMMNYLTTHVYATICHVCFKV